MCHERWALQLLQTTLTRRVINIVLTSWHSASGNLISEYHRGSTVRPEPPSNSPSRYQISIRRQYRYDLAMCTSCMDFKYQPKRGTSYFFLGGGLIWIAGQGMGLTQRWLGMDAPGRIIPNGSDWSVMSWLRPALQCSKHWENAVHCRPPT